MIVWIQGVPNVGKTAVGTKLLPLLAGKGVGSTAFILLDGDDFRKACGNDLGYTLEDRNRNAERIIGIVELLSRQVNLVVCANLTSKKFQKIAQERLDDYFDIYLFADQETLIQRDNKKMVYRSDIPGNENIVGTHVPVSHPGNPYMSIDTSLSTGASPESIARKIYEALRS